MNGIIVYGGKYGSTRQYAEWIAQKTGYRAVPLKKVKSADLSDYQTIVVGGSIKMGKSDAAAWLQKNRSILHGKTVHLFTVSGAGADGEEAERFREAAVPEWLKSSASYHAFPGRWNPAEGPALLRWLFAKLSQKENGTGPMTEMARGFDRMDESSIAPLVSALV